MNLHKPITKSLAVAVFGSQANLAKAIGVKTSALSQWPEVLSKKCRDRVEAAIHRKGLEKEMQAVLRMQPRPTPTVKKPRLPTRASSMTHTPAGRRKSLS